jgi:RHS repeat-associated protein
MSVHLSRRHSTFVAGTTTNFVWDVAGGLHVVLDDGTQYVYGMGLVSQVTSSGTFYYLADGLGSTVAVVDSSGSTVKSYTYDAFGAVNASTGTQNTEYQFAGQQTDPMGLQYLRARNYDTVTGRFLSRDPLAPVDPAGLTPYVYGGDSPVSRIDPDGLSG